MTAAQKRVWVGERTAHSAPTAKDVERQGKWLVMMNRSWVVSDTTSAQFVRRSWKGIPRAVRWQAWSVMVGAHALRERTLKVPPGHDGSEPFRVRRRARPRSGAAEMPLRPTCMRRV